MLHLSIRPSGRRWSGAGRLERPVSAATESWGEALHFQQCACAIGGCLPYSEIIAGDAFAFGYRGAFTYCFHYRAKNRVGIEVNSIRLTQSFKKRKKAFGARRQNTTLCIVGVANYT
jgi:hypothetical protein